MVHERCTQKATQVVGTSSDRKQVWPPVRVHTSTNNMNTMNEIICSLFWQKSLPHLPRHCHALVHFQANSFCLFASCFIDLRVDHGLGSVQTAAIPSACVLWPRSTLQVYNTIRTSCLDQARNLHNQNVTSAPSSNRFRCHSRALLT